MEVHPAYGAPFRGGMIDMSAVVKRRQIPNQRRSANRSPSDIFDQSIVYISPWRDHHGAAGKFAVVESKEQTGSAVDLRFSVHAEWERAAFESGQ